ncbi:cysteine-rich repeat secretory protein 1 [Lactuca sativa]|uniref:cysteine-rich repeat secretory protein 1 n=1 Tax=Lactuca sativa TaxID=4236 RepID=UPI0022AFBF8C|nr:cysteine-rich repeat secretory protein 1 [Lactuca sativa]
MKSVISIAFLLLAIINAVNLVTAQFPAEPFFKCRDTGNYTTRTDYSRNLKVALNTVGNMDTYNGGSFNSSIGVNEAAHVMALCSGVSIHWSGNCKDCIHKLTVQLSIKCMDQKEAVMWGSMCASSGRYR